MRQSIKFHRKTTKRTLQWRDLFLAKAKLQQASNTSALLAGFATVSMVEISFDHDMPSGLLFVFGFSTTLLVVIHLMALMISTCMYPDIEAVSTSKHYQDIRHSPHVRMHLCVELAWILSTGVGILLFLIQMGIIVFVRFNNHGMAPVIASMCVIVPALICFIVFYVWFYQNLIKLKYRQSERDIRQVEALVQQLQINTPPDSPTNKEPTMQD